MSEKVYFETTQPVPSFGRMTSSSSSNFQKPQQSTGNGMNQKTMFHSDGFMETETQIHTIPTTAAVAVDKKVQAGNSNTSSPLSTSASVQNKRSASNSTTGSSGKKNNDSKQQSSINNTTPSSSSSSSVGPSRPDGENNNNLSIDPFSEMIDETTTNKSNNNNPDNSGSVDKKNENSFKVQKVLFYCQSLRLNLREKRQIVNSLCGDKRNSRKLNLSGANGSRPLGPYIQFCSEFRSILKEQNPNQTATELVKNLGAKWQQLKATDRQFLEQKFGLKKKPTN